MTKNHLIIKEKHNTIDIDIQGEEIDLVELVLTACKSHYELVGVLETALEYINTHGLDYE